MAEIKTTLSGYSNASGDIYVFELTNAGDFAIIPSIGNRRFTIELSGITTDYVKILGSLKQSGTFKEIFDEDGITPPLTSNIIYKANDPYQRIKFEKVGSTDTVEIVVNIKNRE